MNIYKLTMAGINVSEGITRFNENEALYEKFLKKFTKDENFDLLIKAMEEQNIKSAFVAAHTIKGIAGNLSLSKLYKDIYPFVEALRSENLDLANELFGKVKEDYEKVVAVFSESV